MIQTWVRFSYYRHRRQPLSTHWWSWVFPDFYSCQFSALGIQITPVTIQISSLHLNTGGLLLHLTSLRHHYRVYVLGLLSCFLIMCPTYIHKLTVMIFFKTENRKNDCYSMLFMERIRQEQLSSISFFVLIHFCMQPISKRL